MTTQPEAEQILLLLESKMFSQILTLQFIKCYCNSWQCTEQHRMVQIGQIYLMGYNGLQSVAWLVLCVWTLLIILLQEWGISKVYAGVGYLVEMVQLICLLETLHASLGIIKSNPAVAFIQWLGRWNVIYFVVHNVPDVQDIAATGVLILAWSLAEVCRYPWYFLNLCNIESKAMTYLRYSAFIPLYPLGVAAEIILVYKSLVYIKERKIYTIALPNQWNFAFDFEIFLKILLVVYLIPFLYLYMYMFSSRRKRLCTQKKVK
eukprot:TRINITY_DN2599_c0_g1_i1.p1 TRINITY_DN2599_c0_g1~~TRINITY_DN2599_c0_g1_i1.p1  ORF type:complete len:262 (-),score=18.90 TRINITY_DN2599_c0_g1_i1:102-887(-)